MFNNNHFVNSGKASKQDLVTRFREDENGGFAVIFGISVGVLFLSAGIAFDYSRISHTKSLMNNALDTAVLSAGHEMSKGVTSESDIRKTFDAFLSANLLSRSLAPAAYEVTEFSADSSTGEIKASISADVEMGMMSIAGYDKVTVGTVSEAVFNASKVEVTMMLDVTGSMGDDDKIGSMKVAAKDAVEILLDDSKTNTRVGLVPYSWSINAASYASTASDGASSKCVTERGTNTYNDKSYETTPVGADPRVTVENKCPDASIMPLSSDKSALLSQISTYEADGYTAGHLGVSWSYYMLSEKWQDLWAPSAKPSDYGAGVQKIAILMTDGEFNTYYDGTGTEGFGGQEYESSNAAEKICTDMKKKKSGKPGITIYSVAFDAPTAAETTLKNCASPDTDGVQHYFSAKNGKELKEAFASIATNIQKLRLSR